MSPRFLSFMKFILEWETVYKKGHWGDEKYVAWENEEGDPGGVTKYGIDQRAHPRVDIKNLTKEQALEIYWTDYWTRNGCEKMPAGVGEAHMNACVNCGSARAKIFLANNSTARGYIESQEAFYQRLVQQKPKFSKFLKGWLNRTHALAKFLKV